MSLSRAEIVNVAVGVIRRNDRVLVAKRPDHLHKGGLWEFPGGKIDAGETVQQALARELNEELGVVAEPGNIEYLFPIDWTYPEKQVRLEICLVDQFSGQPVGAEGQSVKWLALNEVRDYCFPEANAGILDWLDKTG